MREYREAIQALREVASLFKKGLRWARRDTVGLGRDTVGMDPNCSEKHGDMPNRARQLQWSKKTWICTKPTKSLIGISILEGTPTFKTSHQKLLQFNLLRLLTNPKPSTSHEISKLPATKPLTSPEEICKCFRWTS
ncbi:hypothetical protein GQ600_25264 [Phytophthora cactorum]|nr:hypothetical protein GQ600_25264 [Phytophthora cactorum]